MASTNLFIVRHGETEYNRLNRMQGRGIDESLNERGRRQSKAIAGYLERFGLDLTVSSSLARSKETARLVADRFGVKVISYPELDEISFGIIEGKHSDEIENELKILHEQWKNGNLDFALQGGESPREALARVRNRMDSIISEHAGRNILFVLHGRLIRILLSYWLGYGLERMHEIKHCNGSLNHLRWNSNSVEIVCLHKTDHLKEFFPEKADSEDTGIS